MPVTIVIADDYGPLRTGQRLLLSAEPDFCVTGEAEDGETALRLVEDLQPDVLVADLNMPPPTGIELAEMLADRKSSSRVLIVTMYDVDRLAMEAKRAGAVGYLTKRALGTELNTAVRTVASGGSYWPLLGNVPVPGPQNGAALGLLDEADRHLLHMIVECRTRAHIADQLGKTVDAVAQAQLTLMSKLGLCSRAALLHFAQDNNLM